MKELNTRYKKSVKHGISIGLIMAAGLMMTHCIEVEPEKDKREQITEILESGTWRITLFFDGKDDTEVFKDYTFTFDAGGTVVATKDGVNTGGTWDVSSVMEKQASNKLLLTFAGAAGEIGQLTDQWIVIDYNDSLMRFEGQQRSPGEIHKVNKLSIGKK